MGSATLKVLSLEYQIHVGDIEREYKDSIDDKEIKASIRIRVLKIT